jgi:hypothetical protein
MKEKPLKRQYLTIKKRIKALKEMKIEGGFLFCELPGIQIRLSQWQDIFVTAYKTVENTKRKTIIKTHIIFIEELPLDK